jgi:hypothetical protein
MEAFFGGIVASRRRVISRLTLVPGMALIVTTLGSIPGALAQTSFSSFSPPSDSPPGSVPSSPPSSQPSSSTDQAVTDQAVAATTQGAVRSQATSIAGAIRNHIRDIVLWGARTAGSPEPSLARRNPSAMCCARGDPGKQQRKGNLPPRDDGQRGGRGCPAGPRKRCRPISGCRGSHSHSPA